MDELRDTLKPLTDWLPSDVRDRMPVEAWWLIFAAAGLVILLVLGHLLRRMLRGLFARKERKPDWDRELRVDLDECPLPVRPPRERMLTVYHLPVRMRLVVVAPGGKDVDVDPTHVEKLLDRVLPGLGSMMSQDRPRVRVWPPQLSHQGFLAAFQRNTLKSEPEDEPSRWVLVSGRAMLGRQTLLLGLGLWAEEANSLDRITLEPHQWLDVLRLRPVEA
jgi:hypothetical protein